MKKFKILIPNLMVMATIPFVSLVGCNSGGHEEKETKFSVAPAQMIEEGGKQKANLELKWTDGHSIQFKKLSFKFTYNGGTEVNTTTSSEEGDWPYIINLDFDVTPVSEITDGVLIFNYIDKTTGTETQGEVDNIKITIPWLVSFIDIIPSDMISTTSAAINLKWSPSETELNNFENLEFKYNEGGGEANVKLGTSSTGEQVFNLEFPNPVFKPIEDGTLTFNYKISTHAPLYTGTFEPIKFTIPEPEKEFEFEVATHGKMIDETTATIDLTWSPEKTLVFDVDDLEFKYKSGTSTITAKTVTPVGTPTASSQSFNLTFLDPITAEDVTNGTFTFTYIPDQTKGFKYEGNVDGVHIDKWTFEQDSWENVCEYATSLENLKNHYGENTFVGKTKNIVIDGFTYELQVIGENEDYLANSDGKPTETPAALTFMFKTAVQTKNGDEYQPYFVSFATDEESAWNENEIWQNSAPKKYLIEEFLPKLENVLPDGAIKTVSKNTIDNLLSGHVSSYAETLFLPSMADIFSSDDENFQLPSVGDEQVVNKDAYIQEGRKIQSEEKVSYARYSYFNNDDIKPFNEVNPTLAIYANAESKDPTNEVSYWLRSCYPRKLGTEVLANRQEWLWCSSNIDIEEAKQKTAPLQIWKELENEPDPDYMAGLAPIFCI